MTVRLGTAAETVTANNTRKTAALGVADDVNELHTVEDVDEDAVASLGALVTIFTGDGLELHFANLADRRNVGLGEVAGHNLVYLGRFDELNEADLRGIVAVFRHRLELRDDAWADL